MKNTTIKQQIQTVLFIFGSLSLFTGAFGTAGGFESTHGLSANNSWYVVFFGYALLLLLWLSTQGDKK
jgi:hypothetical protein